MLKIQVTIVLAFFTFFLSLNAQTETNIVEGYVGQILTTVYAYMKQINY